MKQEIIVGLILGFFGFFALDFVGIHNLIIKMGVMVVLIILGVMIMQSKKNKEK